MQSTGAVLAREKQAPRATLLTWLSAFRGLHWSKNVLLFVPMLLAHSITREHVLATAAGFGLYSLCASLLYVLNDLLDLPSDRSHPWKSRRPFASGALPVSAGVTVCALGFPLVFAAACWLSPGLGAVLFSYAALTVTYSLYLKKVPLLDVFALTSFYLIRLAAGAMTAHVALSQWFLSFSLFFFFSLAMAKRYSELLHAGAVHAGHRGYQEGDQSVVLMLGICSSFAAVITLSLYVHSPEVSSLYSRPLALTALSPLILYWLSRIWMRAHRGELKDDPVAMAFKDVPSYLIALLLVGSFLAAQPK